MSFMTQLESEPGSPRAYSDILTATLLSLHVSLGDLKNLNMVAIIMCVMCLQFTANSSNSR